MEKQNTIFPDVFIIKPRVFQDERGFFFESYSKPKFEKLGIFENFIQDNHSKSVKNTLRGLHFQLAPGQSKLVRCTKGHIWDVIVDIRPKSPMFKKWFGIILSEENFLQIYIPIGFAHGFSVLSDSAEVLYKVTNVYDPTIEKGVAWDDPDLAVDWKVQNPILSKRDLSNPTLNLFLQEYSNPF